MFIFRLFLAALCAVPLSAATAHEFWIEPFRYQLSDGDPVQAHFRNGENFKGGALSYFDRNSTRFELSLNGKVQAITPRLGDSPALDIAAPAADGLLVVVHETTASQLTYREWEKFLKFARHKDFQTAAEDHLAEGWPQEGFRESYTRHAKSLMALGSGAGTDAPMGLETEFVALTNPYEPGFGGEMAVALTLRGTPRADAQVEVFDRAPEGEVTVTLHRTDADGIARIPVTAGHQYLFDAVVLERHPEADQFPESPVWRTLWAALTFAVPD